MYPYEQSSRIANVLFIFDDTDGINDSCTCAIEVGFSQPYHDLVQNVKLWLEGRRNIQTVKSILSKSKSSRVINPLPVIYLMKKLWTCAFLSKSITTRFGPERGDKDFGPLCLKINGMVFVGEMNGFLEIWEKGCYKWASGNPRRSSCKSCTFFFILLHGSTVTF